MLTKEAILENITEEVSLGTMEIIEQSEKSIRVWDHEVTKEIGFSFLEVLKTETIRDTIYVSKTIPQKWSIDADALAQYLWRVCDRNCFITLAGMYIFWDPCALDPYAENDPERRHLVDVTGDEYAEYLAEPPFVGQLWFERNIVIINAAYILDVSQEIAASNRDLHDPWFSVENQYQKGVLQTAIHELRHLQMDTNPFLPEDIYPISDSSEEAVEAYSQEVFENNSVIENVFPNL